MERIAKRPILSPIIEGSCQSSGCPCNSGANGIFNREHPLLAWIHDNRLLFKHQLNSLGIYRQPDGIRLACGHDGSYWGIYFETWVSRDALIRYSLEIENTFNENFDKMIFQFVRDFECCKDRALKKQ